MARRRCPFNGLSVVNWSWLISLLLVGPAATIRAGQPVQPRPFQHAGIVKAWSTYKHKLTFGKGQTLALVDDGCKLSMPEWSHSAGDQPKVLVAYDSVDGDDDPKHEGKHSNTIRFSEHLIADKYAYAYGIAAADLDRDGDLDLTSADYTPHNMLYLFENDSRGEFKRHVIQLAQRESSYHCRLERRRPAG